MNTVGFLSFLISVDKKNIRENSESKKIFWKGIIWFIVLFHSWVSLRSIRLTTQLWLLPFGFISGGCFWTCSNMSIQVEQSSISFMTKDTNFCFANEFRDHLFFLFFLDYYEIKTGNRRKMNYVWNRVIKITNFFLCEFSLFQTFRQQQPSSFDYASLWYGRACCKRNCV